MPDAVKNIVFKTTVDNKVALDSFDQLGQSVQKLNPELSKIAVTATGKFSPAMNLSRRDVGLFANQMLYTVGATGKLGSQLSNLASGMLMGGAIGGAFAGLAAIINGIITESEDFNKSLEKLGNTGISVAEKVKIFKQELKDLQEPDFWYSVKLGFLNAMGGMSAMLVDIGVRTAELKKAFREGLPAPGTTPFIGGVEGQLEKLRQDQKNAPTKEAAKSFNAEILRLQKEIDDVLGKQEKKVKEIVKTYKSYSGELSNVILWSTSGTPEGKRGGGRRGKPEASSLFGSGAQSAMMAVDEKALQDMKQFSEMNANIFTQNMNQAWENIFGEANSMFEQMISAWSAMLFEKIGFGIFNMLFGGIDLFGFARNLTSGNATSAKYRMGG